MAVTDLVRGANLGNSFDIGVAESNQIHVKTDGTTIQRNAGTGALELVNSTGSTGTMTYNTGTATISYDAGDGGPIDTVDLSALVNAAEVFVTGATLAGNILTLTDQDAGTPDVTVDLNALIAPSADANNRYVIGTDGNPMVPDITAADVTPHIPALTATAVAGVGVAATDVFGNVLDIYSF